MKNIKYAIILALFSILLACNKNAGCLSPYNDCNCADGYEGDNCKTRVTEKFLGKYKLEGLPTADTTGMTVLDSTSQLKKVYFKKFNYRSDYYGDFYGIADGSGSISRTPGHTGAIYPLVLGYWRIFFYRK